MAKVAAILTVRYCDPTFLSGIFGPFGAHDIFSLVPRFPAMLVLGGEDAGLRPNMLKRCDALVKFPMLRVFDSITVAQAGAIILGWFANQMAKKS